MSGTKKMSNAARAAGAEIDPGAKEHKDMFRKLGFTLVELLVVIAIISILAAIVTPKVQGFILRSRMTNTVAEIQGIETALAKMLTDCGKSSFRQMFDPPLTTPVDKDTGVVNYGTLRDDLKKQTYAFYSLLRQGRNADLTKSGLTLATGVKDKLATSYVDANQDAWDRQYQFWAGPWGSKGDIPFRCYRPGFANEDGTYLPYIYSEDNAILDENGNPSTRDRKEEADKLIPGNPALDDEFGFPAPKDLGIYIFSLGVNGRNDQLFNVSVPEDEFKGGGDDINNWDSGEQGWTGFYS